MQQQRHRRKQRSICILLLVLLLFLLIAVVVGFVVCCWCCWVVVFFPVVFVMCMCCCCLIIIVVFLVAVLLMLMGRFFVVVVVVGGGGCRPNILFCKSEETKHMYIHSLSFASLRSDTSSMQVWSQTFVFLYSSIFHSDKTCVINFALSYPTIVLDIIFITITCIWLLFTCLWSSKVSYSTKTCILHHITKIKLIFIVD